jgi:hypothetical protein
MNRANELFEFESSPVVPFSRSWMLRLSLGGNTFAVDTERSRHERISWRDGQNCLFSIFRGDKGKIVFCHFTPSFFPKI